jgi:formamidopyrimidine-DNA glycosylase
MPELPEVETIARGLNREIAGQKIESVWLGPKREPLKSTASEIARRLRGKKIVRVRRAGKHIVFDLGGADDGRPHSAKEKEQVQWVVHLGMTGSLLVSSPGSARERHTHAILRLSSGREVRFVDPRRFGRLSVVEDFQAAGAEPLSISLADFTSLFHKRKTPIKSALLNQKLLSGVGNIYADEALFRAGIRPRRRASSLSRAELRRLHNALQVVLKQAIRLGGSSISDYVDADGEEGFFQRKHRVYGRAGKACLVCKRSIRRVVIAGRSSHYCPQCQN